MGAFPDAYDPVYGYRGLSNLRCELIRRPFRVWVENNSLGYRDDEWKSAKDRARLIVLGDSYAWGWGVAAHERFSDLLERRHTDLEVLNMAQSGYSTDQELLVLDREGAAYRPDLVLVQFSDNDITDGNNTLLLHGSQPKPMYEPAGDELRLRGSPVPLVQVLWERKTAGAHMYGSEFVQDKPAGDRLERAPATTVPILRRMHLLNLLRRTYVMWRRKAASTGTATPAGDQSLGHREHRPSEIALTMRIFAEMKRFCDERGISLGVLCVPSSYDQEIAGGLRELGVPCLLLDDALSHSFRPVIIRDDGHWSALGHESVADAIDGFLVSAFPDLPLHAHR